MEPASRHAAAPAARDEDRRRTPRDTSIVHALVTRDADRVTTAFHRTRHTFRRRPRTKGNGAMLVAIGDEVTGGQAVFDGCRQEHVSVARLHGAPWSSTRGEWGEGSPHPLIPSVYPLPISSLVIAGRSVKT